MGQHIATGTSTVAASNQNVGYTPNQGLGGSDRRYRRRDTLCVFHNVWGKSCGKSFSRSRYDERETRTHAPTLPFRPPCCRTPTLLQLHTLGKGVGRCIGVWISVPVLIYSGVKSSTASPALLPLAGGVGFRDARRREGFPTCTDDS